VRPAVTVASIGIAPSDTSVAVKSVASVAATPVRFLAATRKRPSETKASITLREWCWLSLTSANMKYILIGIGKVHIVESNLDPTVQQLLNLAPFRYRRVRYAGREIKPEDRRSTVVENDCRVLVCC
jgi:hypothetical protein